MMITFDCYGTLIDWEAGIVRAFTEAAAADGVTLDPAAIVAAHAAIEPAMQAEGYRSYREVLAATAAAMATRLGWRALTAERAAFLPESVPSWAPFPDTNAALERLAARGYQLGVLSNVDDDLFAGTRRHFTVEFDLIVTAQQVRSYKPAPQHFVEARRRIGGRPWLHAAASYFHDVEPAVRHGVPVVWVNRTKAMPAGAERPLAEVEHLGALVEWLERDGPRDR